MQLMQVSYDRCLVQHDVCCMMYDVACVMHDQRCMILVCVFELDYNIYYSYMSCMYPISKEYKKGKNSTIHTINTTFYLNNLFVK